MGNTLFGPQALVIADPAKEVEKICASMRDYVAKTRKKGVVVAMSGGIDSSCVAALAVKALGKDRVFGLLMPEKESSDETLGISRGLAEHLGIQYTHEDISGLLDAAGCYRRRDEAIRLVYPSFGKDHKAKIVLPSVVDNDSFRLYSVVVQSPDGKQEKVRLTPEAYLGIVAATNFKQRCRKMLEYYHADRLNYAVTGTPNRLEYDQGFFVKLGDGAADLKPIAHLYKSQVYQLAGFLGVPENILKRPPTTDTYSLPQGQDEFYFSLPYAEMDLVLYGKNNGIAVKEIAAALKLDEKAVQRVFTDIDQKRRSTEYLHMYPALMGDVPEIKH